MRIDRIRIESYGEKEGLTLDFDRSPFQLVYGENEAGKSTLLSLIRNMFFNRNAKETADVPFALRGVEARCSLDFRLANGANGTLYRSWDLQKGKSSEFSCRIDQTEITEDEFDKLLRRPDRSSFSQLFAFTYADLVRGGKSLGREELSKILYGALAGDEDRAAAVLKDLEDRMEKLFKKKGRTQKILLSIARVKEYSGRIQEAANPAAKYRAMRAQLEAEQREAEAQAALRAEADSERLRWDLAIRARGEYLKYRHIGDELIALSSNPVWSEKAPEFTDDDEKRCAELDVKIANLREAVRLLSEEIVEIAAKANCFNEERIDLYMGAREEIQYAADELRVCREKRDSLPGRRSQLETWYDALVRSVAEFAGIDLSAPEETRSAQIEACRNAPTGAWLDVAREHAAEETRLQEDLRDARNKLSTHNGDEASDRIALEHAKGEMKHEFANIPDGAVVATREAKIALAASDPLLRSLAEETGELQESKTSEQRLARELVAQAYDGIPELSDVQIAQILDRPVEPLEFQTLKSKIDAELEKLDQAERDIASLLKETEELKSEEEGDPNVDARLESEIAERRTARDQAWDALKSAWFAETPIPYDQRRRLVEGTESEFRALDDLWARCAEANRALGALESRNAALGRRRDELAAAYERQRKARAAVDSLREEARAMWERFGFASCARWNDEESARWLESWRNWRELRTGNERRAQGLVQKGAEIRTLLTSAAAAFALWGLEDAASRVSVPEDPTDLLNVLTSFRQRLDSLRILADGKAQRYEELQQNVSTVTAQLEQSRTRARESQSKADACQTSLDALQKELASFCKDKEIPIAEEATSSWNALVRALERWRDWKDDVDQYASQVDKFRADEEAVENYEQRVAALDARLGTGLADRLELATQKWFDELAKAKTDNALLNKTRDDLDKKTREREGRQASLDEALREFGELLAKSGASADQFGDFRAYAAEWRRLNAEFRRQESTLESVAGIQKSSPGWESFCADVELEPEELERLRDAASQKAAECEEAAKERNQLIGQLKQTLEGYERRGDEAGLLLARQAETQRLRAYVDEYMPLRLAKDALEEALDRFKNQRVPDLLAAAGIILERVTAGRYDEVKTDGSAEDRCVVRERSGRFKRMEELSAGTREQLYLALRLALLRQYGSSCEPLPVFMDDVLVNSDETRARRLLGALGDFATESQQLVLLSCRRATRDAFADAFGEGAVVELQGQT